MKKIIVYGSHLGHEAIWPYAVELAQAFRLLGYKVMLCDINDVNSARPVYEHLLVHHDIAFTVGIMECGLQARLTADSGMVNVYAHIDTPHVSYLFDVPYNKATYGYDVPGRHHAITLMDRDAEEYFKYTTEGHDKKRFFLPPGGTASSCTMTELLSSTRPYDTVVCATHFATDAPAEPLWHDPGWLYSQLRPLLDEVAEYMLAQPVTTITAFAVVLRQRGLDKDEYMPRLIPFLWPMLLYVKQRRRELLVEALQRSGVRVLLIGDNWDRLDTTGLEVQPAMGYGQLLDVLRQTKVVVSDMGEFNNGGHERIFTAMLHGAVVVSEYSRYIAEEFADGEDIFLYDWRNIDDRLTIIPELLTDEAARTAIATRAYQKVSTRHRWINRARSIAGFVKANYAEYL